MRKYGVLAACGMLLLAGCGTKKTNAARPPEDGRLKGHQKPYVVNGERYEPLQSHEGFVQTGTASWYGPDFHGKRTSNGEVYDMHAMTAAHKTLPLGVFVKVRNRESGEEAVVRVNDRGPFVKGRIIDLSYAAARKLGVVQNGTAPVRIEALGYRVTGEDGKETYAPVNYDRGDYTVQTGSFTVNANAERQAAAMKQTEGFSDIRRVEVNGETFFRVYAGRYASLRAAEAARERFERSGYPGSFVVSLD
jgi:rare lipoprotein A